MLKNILLIAFVVSLGVNAGKKCPSQSKNTRTKQHQGDDFDDLDEEVLAKYMKEADEKLSNSRFKKNKKLENIQELDTPEARQKVKTDNKNFRTLAALLARYDNAYETLEAKQKQIEMEHNTTQHDLQSQFDQISQRIQSYQSQLNDIHEIQDQANEQIKLFQNTVLKIEQLIKKRGSVHLNSGQFIELCNQANRALAAIDTNLQLFCTNQGKGSHTTLQTRLNNDRNSHTYKTTVCSNTRVGHMRDTLNRIVNILNESQHKQTELSRKEQTQEEQINMEMKYIIEQQNVIVNKTKIKLGVLQQEILSLKTYMSQLTTQKENILMRLESMVDGNDFVTRRFSHAPLQTYYIIQFYIDTVLPLLIEQRVRWYVSCYSEEEALLCHPFIELNSTSVKFSLFDKASAWHLADKYNASIDFGLKSKDMYTRDLRALYQKRNDKLSQYMQQMENAVKHIGSFSDSTKMLLLQIQEQLNLRLGSLTFPVNQENVHLVPTIHDDWKHNMVATIDYSDVPRSNRSAIAFQNFTLIGDMFDTKRHMPSFMKKQYDLALHYQSKMDEFKNQTGQDLDTRMDINLLEWSILYNDAYLLFLKVKALGIDPTDEMMKSALGLITYRVEYLKEKEIDSMEFYQQIINKTYINYWQNSSIVDEYQKFVNEILPFLETI